MPALSDDMYCSEQICIPPSFPYLLRQYAKAAIRSQPTDLLKWSTAYFRCLSLNVPPPVKPRLEYPIPRDFNGITPGWLKALLYQLQNNLSIPFKILWDRWIGACLQHHTLIQLLCLGGFDDPNNIPWLKFIAICASTLTDDLTKTMILICEILTEEPEGGSAMITLETFVDLYKYLAKIDASNGQILRNYFFRDSLLSLWKEKVEKDEVKESEQEMAVLEVEESVISKTSTESVDEGEKLDDVDKVVSCPSLPEDDHYSIDYLMKEEAEIEGEGGEESGFNLLMPEEEMGEKTDQQDEENEEELNEEEPEDQQEFQEPKEEFSAEELPDVEGEETEKLDDTREDAVVDESGEGEPLADQEEVVDGEDLKEGQATDVEPSESVAIAPTASVEKEDGVKPYESVETIVEQPVRDLEHVFEDDATLREDLERLRALQQELAGETDEELEKFKCRLIEEMPLTQSQEEGIKHFQIKKSNEEYSEGKLKLISEERVKSGDLSSESQDILEADKKAYDDIYVEAIPGIGETVPEELIQAVVAYMEGCAKNQHGMVMPRNIRHYNCPPLEAGKH